MRHAGSPGWNSRVTQSLPHRVRTSISHGNKRFIAVVMLLVWTLAIGAGFASACVLDEAGSTSATREHHADTTSVVMVPVLLTADGNHLHAPGQGGDNHVGLHQVRCQPYQAPVRANSPGPLAEKSLDLDAVAATFTHWTKPVHLINLRFSVRQPPDYAVAKLPLFIRFRRLIP